MREVKDNNICDKAVQSIIQTGVIPGVEVDGDGDVSDEPPEVPAG